MLVKMAKQWSTTVYNPPLQTVSIIFDLKPLNIHFYFRVKPFVFEECQTHKTKPLTLLSVVCLHESALIMLAGNLALRNAALWNLLIELQNTLRCYNGLVSENIIRSTMDIYLFNEEWMQFTCMRTRSVWLNKVGLFIKKNQFRIQFRYKRQTVVFI